MVENKMSFDIAFRNVFFIVEQVKLSRSLNLSYVHFIEQSHTMLVNFTFV